MMCLCVNKTQLFNWLRRNTLVKHENDIWVHFRTQIKMNDKLYTDNNLSANCQKFHLEIWMFQKMLSIVQPFFLEYSNFQLKFSWVYNNRLLLIDIVAFIIQITKLMQSSMVTILSRVLPFFDEIFGWATPTINEPIPIEDCLELKCEHKNNC